MLCPESLSIYNINMSNIVILLKDDLYIFFIHYDAYTFGWFSVATLMQLTLNNRPSIFSAIHGCNTIYNICNIYNIYVRRSNTSVSHTIVVRRYKWSKFHTCEIQIHTQVRCMYTRRFFSSNSPARRTPKIKIIHCQNKQIILSILYEYDWIHPYFNNDI